MWRGPFQVDLETNWGRGVPIKLQTKFQVFFPHVSLVTPPLTLCSRTQHGLPHTSSVLTMEHQVAVTLAILGSLVAAILTPNFTVTQIPNPSHRN